MSVGRATRLKSCAVEKWKLPCEADRVDAPQHPHTEGKELAKIENVMLRRATDFPRRSQNSSSSGCHSSIHGFAPIANARPPARRRTAPSVSVEER